MEHGWCEQFGDVKLTRAQYKEYRALLYAYDMRRYCYKIYRQRKENAEMAARDAETIEREEATLRRWHWRAAGLTAVLVLAGMAVGLLTQENAADAVFVFLMFAPAALAALFWGDGMERTLEEGRSPWKGLAVSMVVSVVAGVLMVLAFWAVLLVVALFALLLPSSRHRQWRGWQFGRRHS